MNCAEDISNVGGKTLAYVNSFMDISCKLKIVCADGRTVVVPCPEGRSLTENFQFFSYGTL